MGKGLTKRYRISTNLVEIFETVETALKSQGHFIWHVVGDRRLTYPLQVTHLKAEAGQVLVSIENKSDSFRQGETVYVRLSSRDAAFKTTVIKMNDFEVLLGFPSELLLSENRSNKRHQFNLNDEKTIKVKRVENQISSFREKSFILPVFDVSAGGFAAFVPNDTVTALPIGATLVIEYLGDQKLQNPLTGFVASSRKYTLKSKLSTEQGMRIGISLDKRIPDNALEKFLVRPKLFEIGDQRLIVDMAHRKKIHDAMEDTLKRVSKARSFKDQFKSFVVNRNANDYIKIHTNLLVEVLCSVGLKLGWVTDKTLDKLVYVAYLHDVYLFNHPHLAKIKSQVELARANDLSSAERKLYLDSPLYSAELARRDTEAYPDAVKILMQQRELPDGSGFPYGTTAAGLTPLSCLFIFCHYLVDYMIEDPMWSLDAFMKSHQRILRGGYFTKIYQSLQP
jgi:hypothetical protein